MILWDLMANFSHRDLMRLIRICGDFSHGSTGISPGGIVARLLLHPERRSLSSAMAFQGLEVHPAW